MAANPYAVRERKEEAGGLAVISIDSPTATSQSL
jgi:hypothetical protein